MDTIDYSGYSYAELVQAQSGINPAKYPENYQALVAELEKRQPETEKRITGQTRAREKAKTKELISAKKKIEVLGLLQIIAALILGYVTLSVLISGASVSYLLLLVIILLTALNAFCGYTLLTKKSHWYWLSIVNQGLQIPNVMFGSFIINYSSLGGFYLGLGSGGTFSFTAVFNPGFQFYHLQERLAEYYFGVDIVAFVFLLALLIIIKAESSPEGSAK